MRRRRFWGVGGVGLVARAIVCLAGGFVIGVLVAWIAAVRCERPGTVNGAAFSAYRVTSRVVPERLVRVLPSYRETTYEAAEVAHRARAWGLEREQVWVRLVRYVPPLPYRDPAGEEPEFAQGLVLPRDLRAISVGDVDDPTVPVDLYRAGWPMPALEWTDPEFDRPGVRGLPVFSKFERAWEFGIEPAALRGAAGTVSTSDAWRRLAVRMSGSGLGLVVNTLVWAGLVAVLLWMPSVARRWRRTRRGMCRECGYPVRGGDGNWMQRCPECGAPTRGGGRDAGTVGSTA